MNKLIPAFSSSALALAALIGVGSALAVPVNQGPTVLCKTIRVPTVECPAGKTISSGACKTVMVTTTICKPVAMPRKFAALGVDALPTASASARA